MEAPFANDNAADLSVLFDWLVRISVIHAHPEPDLREAKLAEMIEFVKKMARRGRENGVNFCDEELNYVAGAVAANARAFLVLMPTGGRA